MGTFDVSDSWLKLSYFFVTHRSDLKKWWVILFAALDVFLVVFVLTNLFIYAFSFSKNSATVPGIVETVSGYETIRSSTEPIGLRVVSTATIPTSAGKFDLLAEVSNPNATWAIERVVPTFGFRGQELAGEPDFFLPNEKKWLFIFNVSSGTAAVGGQPETVSVRFDEPTWRRLPERVALPPTDFALSGVAHRVVSGGTRTTVSVSEVSGELENRTVENFWQVRLKIVAMSGSTPVGINQIFLDRVEGLSRRPFTVQWSSALVGVTDVTVVPEVNVLEEGSTYLK